MRVITHLGKEDVSKILSAWLESSNPPGVSTNLTGYTLVGIEEIELMIEYELTLAPEEGEES